MRQARYSGPPRGDLSIEASAKLEALRGTITGLPLKFPDRLITRCLSGPRLSTFDSRLMMFHTLNLFPRHGTKACPSHPMPLSEAALLCFSAHKTYNPGGGSHLLQKKQSLDEPLFPPNLESKAIAGPAFPP